MLFSSLIYIVAVALTIIATDAAPNERKRSTCRQTPIFQNFEMNNWLGHWYIHSHHQHDFEAGCDCFTSEVMAIDPTSMRVSNCCQFTHITDEMQSCNVSVDYVRFVNPEKREASFFFTRAGVTLESPAWFVDTDYENYTVINGCDHVSDDEEREVFWILTRSRIVSETVWEKIDAVLKANNFEKNKIARQRHGTDVCKSRRAHRHFSGKEKLTN